MKTAQQNFIITGLLVVILPVFLAAQEPYTRLFLKNTQFGEAQINCTFQDQQGYLWIGTDNGLYKHDGTEIIASQEIEDLYRSGVSAIGEDQNGNMWFGLENGMILMQSPDGNPEPFPADSFPDKRITTIQAGRDNLVWFGTYGDGLYYTDGNGLLRIDNEHALTDNYIYSIERDEHGNLWLGTDNGINIIRTEKNKIHVDQLSVSDGLPDFIVQCIDRDREGNMWIGMHENGICKYNPVSGQFMVPDILKDWTYGPVNDVLVMDDRLWIATDGHGIVSFRFANQKKEIFTEGENTSLLRIKSMHQDQEGNVWLVSHPEIGISLGNKMEFYKKIGNTEISNVHALVNSLDGMIWFGNDQGLFRYNPMAQNGQQQLTAYALGLNLERQKIMSLYADDAGFIWVGTFGQGVIRLDPETGHRTRYSEEDGLVNANILAIEGNERDIWFATLGGAARISTGKGFDNLSFDPRFENFGQKEGLSNNFIYDIHIDQNNVVWFATDGSGVIYYDQGDFSTITADSGFNNKVVYSVVSDLEGDIWMNIAHEGLYRWDGNEIVKFFNDPEHNALSFNGILANNNHELVIAYDNGIDVLNTLTGNIMHFEQNAGLGNIKPDLNTLAKDAEGSIWIGTAPFIVKYKPADTAFWKHPQTRINKVELFLEKIDTASQHIFNYDENHFSFDYSGLWFQYPDKVYYRVKLQGHDLDWMQTKNNRVIYSNLSPGQYTFKVVSGLYEDFGNVNEATYSFTIKKPFWATVWFLILMVLILGGVILAYIKVRERNIRRKQAIIRDRIMFQYENLKSQINPHFLFNSFSTLIALIETEPESAIEYVTELSALFRNVLEYKDKEVITLEEELDIAQNYIQLQKKRYGDNLIIESDIPGNLKNSKIPPLTLQLLIENALKHNVVSRDRPLTISIECKLPEGYIFVKNNLQLKKEVLSSTGIGIETIVNRYRILTQKNIIIDKTEQSFIIGIPIIKA